MKAAIIGAGYFANFHAEAWQRIDEVTIVAVVDPSLERAEEFAAKWKIPHIYREAAELFSRQHGLDFVDIVTRPESHLELTRMAADHRTNIICQKPMAPSWSECVQMVQMSEDRGTRLLIHENWRWQPWYQEMKRLLDEGRLGKLFHLGYRLRTGDGRGDEPYKLQPYFRRMKRFLVYETVIHFLDTFRFLEGDISSVFCRMCRLNPVIEGEDSGQVQIEFASGALGFIDANRISGPPLPTLTFGECWLEGEKASLRLREDGRIGLKEHGGEERRHSYDFVDSGYRGGSVEATQRHCISAFRTGTRCETEGREYLKTMATVFACYHSAECGRPINPKEAYES